MKNIFTLLAAGLLALGSLTAAAQQYQPQAIGTLTGGTNNVVTATTNTYNAAITVSRSTDVAIQPIFRLTGAGTGIVTFLFDYSVDGTNWVANGGLAVTSNGTNTVSGITNITANAVGYYRLSTVANTNSQGVTNLIVMRAAKPNRSGN